ncbi:MAG: hypothetical protein WCR74_10440 [Betaproteobacteria bacterium]
MTSMKNVLLLAITLTALPAFAQAPAPTPAAKPADNMQQLRDKLSGDKKLVVTANLELTEAEAKAFWPVYEAYQKELYKINDKVALLIVNYSKEYNAKTLTDAKALALLNQYFALEESEVKLVRSFVPKLNKALPGRKVARYMQIENKIRAIVKFEIAREVPLAS